MDSPFFPAIVCFGPFFVILLSSAVVRHREQRVRVRPVQVATALLVSLGIGLGGVVASLLMF